MKTQTKVIWGLSVALVILVSFIVWYFLNTPDRQTTSPVGKKIEEATKKQIQTEAAEIKKSVDQNGFQHTVSKMAKEVDQSELDKIKADLLDTAAALGIAQDKIKQIMLVNLNLTITNQKLVKKISDSSTEYSHSDDRFKLTVNIPKDSSQSAYFSGSYNADLIASQYYRTRWLIFQEPLIDIYTNDKRFTNNGLKTFTVKPKQTPIGFKVEVRSGYNRLTGASGGSGLSLRVGKLTAKAGYQYYPDFKQWAPDYGLNFKLIGTN